MLRRRRPNRRALYRKTASSRDRQTSKAGEKKKKAKATAQEERNWREMRLKGSRRVSAAAEMELRPGEQTSEKVASALGRIGARDPQAAADLASHRWDETPISRGMSHGACLSSGCPWEVLGHIHARERNKGRGLFELLSRAICGESTHHVTGRDPKQLRVY